MNRISAARSRRTHIFPRGEEGEGWGGNLYFSFESRLHIPHHFNNNIRDVRRAAVYSLSLSLLAKTFFYWDVLPDLRRSPESHLTMWTKFLKCENGANTKAYFTIGSAGRGLYISNKVSIPCLITKLKIKKLRPPTRRRSFDWICRKEESTLNSAEKNARGKKKRQRKERSV